MDFGNFIKALLNLLLEALWEMPCRRWRPNLVVVRSMPVFGAASQRFEVWLPSKNFTWQWETSSFQDRMGFWNLWQNSHPTSWMSSKQSGALQCTIVYLAFLPHVFWCPSQVFLRGSTRSTPNRRINGTYLLGSQSTSGLSDHCQESARQASWLVEREAVVTLLHHVTPNQSYFLGEVYFVAT